MTGTVGKKKREDAFNYYEKVRSENPGREIVITGHSLGGHLAQYVGVKAFNTNGDENLLVRTFNTAPAKTTHAKVFKSKPELENAIVNYRLSQDVISDLPLQNIYGQVFDFQSYSRNALTSHKMYEVRNTLPKDLKETLVGSNGAENPMSRAENKLQETVIGALESYRCRVNGQWFSGLRQGMKNLEALEGIKDKLKDAIKEKNYDKATELLQDVKNDLRGSNSIKLVNTLIKDIERVNPSKSVNHSKSS